jgi:hypothetical protein
MLDPTTLTDTDCALGASLWSNVDENKISDAHKIALVYYDGYVSGLQTGVTRALGSVEYRSMDYQDYLRSDRWRTIRRLKREQAGEKCELCNSEDRLEVHHRTYDRRGEERLSDLTVLCHSCHERFSKSDGS